MRRPDLELERAVATAWRVLFRCPTPSAYERAARLSFVVAGSPVGSPAIRRVLASCRTTVFGDDLLVPDDREAVLKAADGFGRGEKVVLVTDRRRRAAATGTELWARVRKRHWRVAVCQGDRRIVRAVREAAKRGERAFVWTGALRLAPGHLPALFRRAGLPASFFLLEAAETRWRSGRSQGWVEIGAGRFAFVGRSPLLSLAYFPEWNLRSGSVLRSRDLEREFFRSLRATARRFGGAAPSPPRKIFTPFDTEVFAWLTRGKPERRQARFLRERLFRGESAVIPQRRTALLSTLDPGEIAEEAAHYLRLAGEKADGFGPFRTLLEEGLAFLASRCSSPGRRIPRFDESVDRAWGALHEAGYRLGGKLVRRWPESRANRDLIRAIWRRKPRGEREALLLLEALRRITEPEVRNGCRKVPKSRSSRSSR